MNLMRLRYFSEVVNAGSIKGASERVHVAQPALSVHMRNLEVELNVKLLHRSAKGVKPTEAGKQLFIYVQPILALVKEAAEKTKCVASEPSGSVTLGLPSSVSLALTVPLLEKIREELPKVSLRIFQGMSGHILEWLRAGQIEMAMLYNIEHSTGVSLTPLLREELYLVRPAAADRKPGGATESTLRFDKLAYESLILPGEPHGLRTLVEEAAQAKSIGLNVCIELDSLSEIKTLVMRGLGSTVLSHSAVREELDRGELEVIRITDPVIDRSVYIAQLLHHSLSSAAYAVHELINSCVKQLVEDGLWKAELHT
jgi:LysR family nitrogen assimilation transcriptional regulator